MPCWNNLQVLITVMMIRNITPEPVVPALEPVNNQVESFIKPGKIHLMILLPVAQ